MDIKVPEVGESIIEVEIGQWFKKDGEQVAKDDLLLELETEKVNVELNADGDGRLEILAKEGETVKVGDVIGRIDEQASDSETKEEEASAEETSQSDAEEESQQESAEAESTQDKPEDKSAEESQSEADTQQDTDKGSPAMNPAVAKLAEERGVDLSRVEGSGRNGRILVDDLPETGDKQKQEKEEATKKQAESKSDKGKPEEKDRTEKKTTDAKPRDEERTKRVAMSQIRKKIAQHLLKARQETAMLTTFNEIDMSRLIALRKEHKESFAEKHGVSLGFMSFFVKASAEALKEFAEVNARIDGDDIVYQNFYDIGVAVGSKRGLVVPIIRDADQLNFAEVEKVIRDYAERAESGKLSLDELSGGTFTISNGGIYGSVLSTPLLNPPQSAILGMHAIQERAVVRDGEIVIRPIMNVALSYDHRIIDGKEAVSFLKQIKDYIEDPAEMLLDM